MTKTKNKYIRAKEILVKKYVLAATNLYGVITIDDLVLVYNYHEEESVTKKEVESFLETMTFDVLEDVTIREGILANWHFDLLDDQAFKQGKSILEIQQEKPRYLPDRKEFLRYLDTEYVEPMKPLNTLEFFITDNKLVPMMEPDDIKYDVLELHDQITDGLPLSDFYDHINNRGYEFKDEAQFDLFTELLIKVQNQTRLYENNGHTPIEINNYFKKDIKTSQ